MQKLDSKVANLEFQLLYGDTMKDREISQLNQSIRDLEAKYSSMPKSVVEDTEYQRVLKECQDVKMMHSGTYDELVEYRKKEDVSRAKIQELENALKDCQLHAEDAETRCAIATRALSEHIGDRVAQREQKLAERITEQVCGRLGEQISELVSDRVSTRVSERLTGKLSSDVQAAVRQEVSSSNQGISQAVQLVNKRLGEMDTRVTNFTPMLYAVIGLLAFIFLSVLLRW
jgi:hypothetical protein